MKENRKLALGGIALAISSVLLLGVGAAVLDQGSVSVDDPENQTIAVDADFSYAEDLTVDLVQDGTTVRTETITGTAGYENTSTMDLTGIQSGTFDLNITSTDDTNVSLQETRMETTRQTGINITENDTLLVDVEFDAVETTTALVEIEDETGSTVNSTTLTFDPIEASDGSGIITEEYTADRDLGNVTVHVTTSEIWGHESVYVTDERTTSGGGAGTVDGKDLVGYLGSLGPVEYIWIVVGAFSVLTSFYIMREV
jgi:hypothetical protein